MNPALIELAAILLQFEVERLERQKITAANGDVSEATPKTTATDQPQKANRQGDSTPMPGNRKKAEMSASDSN